MSIIPTAHVSSESGCYLPWCTACYPPTESDISTGEYGHLHVGARESVTVTAVTDAAIGIPEQVLQAVVTVDVTRLDYEQPDGVVTGRTHVYLAGCSAVCMEPEDALVLAEAIALRARLAIASRGVINPLVVTA